MKNGLPPVIGQVDAQSAVWLKLKKHIGERLETLRAKNDADQDERKTSRLRGRIAELKYLMALDSPAPSLEADDAE